LDRNQPFPFEDPSIPIEDPSRSLEKPRRRRWQVLAASMRKTLPFLGGILAAFIALWLYHLAFPDPRPLSSRDVKDTVNQVLASATPQPAFSERVYQIIQPSLVLVQSRVTSGKQKDQGLLGSGVIVDDRGDILTSLHVVDGADQIQLTFADGTQSDAEIITKQPENDIAVLRAATLPAVVVPATLGSPSSMRVGDEVYAVGNPFGLYNSLSAGVISGFDRPFHVPGSDQVLKGLIQIDAAVNPGNSGGPLLNRDGSVIGIVTGIANPTGEEVFIGIGFAVPINVAGGAIGSPLY
jgi:S1-C subfamily serine protease